MKFTPIKITLIYLVVALLWIALSDRILFTFTEDILVLSELQTLKGFFYVTATAAGLYFMINEYKKYLLEQEKEHTERLKSYEFVLKSVQTATWEYFPENGTFITSENHNELLGLGKNEAPDIENILDHVHPEDKERVEECVSRAISKGEKLRVDYRVLKKNQSIHWLRVVGIAILQEGKVIKYSGTLTDITEQKQLQKSLKREQELKSRLFDTIPVMITIYDPNLSKIEVNREFEKITGWNNSDLADVDIMKKLYPDEKYRSEVIDFMKSPDGSWKEIKLVRKDGHILETTWTNIELSDDTQIGIGLDVTEQITLRKKIDRDRKELITIFDSMPVFVTIQDGKGGIKRVNQYVRDLLGFEESYSSGDLLREMVPDEEEYLRAKKHMLNSDGIWKDFRLITQDGTIIESSWTNVKLSDSQTIGIGTNITKRKELENQIKENEERLRLATNSARVGLWEWHPETGSVFIDEMWANLVGYSKNELEPISIETWNRLVHPDDLKMFEKVSSQYLKGERATYECEVRMKHKKGHWVWILDRGKAVGWYDNGEVEKMVGTHIDITERKKIEKIEKYNSMLLKNISEAVISTDANFNIKSWNNQAEELFGWREKDVLGRQYMDVLETDFLDTSQDEVQNWMEKHGSWRGEVIQKRKDGTKVNILNSSSFIYDADGNMVGAMSVSRDITVLKQTEKELIRSRNKLLQAQKRFEIAANITSDVIWEWQPKNNYLWWGEGIESVLGFKKEEYEKGNNFWRKQIVEEDRKRVIESMELAEKNNESVWWDEYRFVAGDGSIRIIEDSARLLYDENGELDQIIGAMVDVTDRREAQEQLRTSEKQYRLLFEESPIPIWIYDPKTLGFVEVNQAAIEKYGYSAEEFKELKLYDLHPEDELDEVKNEIKMSLKKRKTGFDTWTQITKNGEKIITEISGSEIYYDDRPHRLVVANDITLQRKSEERAIKAIVEGEERERQRIAKELHDGLGQYLSAANMNLQTVFEDTESKIFNKSHKKAFRQGLEQLQHAILESRNISQNLMPKAIQDYGLLLAVESLASQLNQASGIDIRFYSGLKDIELKNDIEINLYRIIQEALSNSIKHSKCSKIVVQIIESDGDLICTIEDNGVGFNPKHVESEGLGLQSMKTRVGALSANLDITSSKKLGTLITVIIPLS